MATRLPIGLSAVWIPVAVIDFSVPPKVQTLFGTYPAPCSVGIGVLFRAKSGLSVNLTTHLHLVPRWRMSGAVPLLPSYMPLWREQGLYFLSFRWLSSSGMLCCSVGYIAVFLERLAQYEAKMKVLRSPETSGPVYQTTWRHIWEILSTHHCAVSQWISLVSLISHLHVTSLVTWRICNVEVSSSNMWWSTEYPDRGISWLSSLLCRRKLESFLKISHDISS